MSRVISLLAVLAVAASCACADCISLRSNPTFAESAAAGDLQRAILAATGVLVPIRTAKAGDANVIAVGHAAGRKVDLSPKVLGEQGFVLKTFREGKRTVLVAAGATPIANAYAAFTLAEEFGAGFYLGGDAMPGREARERRVESGEPGRESGREGSFGTGVSRNNDDNGRKVSGMNSRNTGGLRLPDLDVVKKPAFEVRGVLPWYNFFNSPTAWNAEDYRFFIDQLAKSKNNFLGFHSYDFEPFCAYRNARGELVAGQPLQSTAQSCWGTVPMKTSEFAFGTDRYFDKGYFGADCSMGEKDLLTSFDGAQDGGSRAQDGGGELRETGIGRAQKLLADALWYARARGVRTCVGFEATGDPTTPGALDELELRLKATLKAYPMLDYVWIWESEAMGLHGINTYPLRSDFGAYYRRWEKEFDYITDTKRRSEAVRCGIYALAAHRIIKREAPRVKMILSGWGGDNHLRFTDFYVGLDKVLPKDIIFSALDNIVVSDTVSEAYGKLSKDREFWPIPWLEYDGDQWFPQANARRFYNCSRDALKKGAKGLLGIHWRTRDVEESHAYASQFAWNTDLGWEEFYRGYAERTTGNADAAKLMMALQDLGYRWIGGGGQMECGGFQWSPGVEGGVERLEEVVRVYGRGLDGEYIDYLKQTATWAAHFDRAAKPLWNGGEVRSMLSRIRGEGRKATAEESTRLWSLVDEATDELRQAMRAYARRVSNRGELGVLATINAKAWADLRGIRKAVEEVTGSGERRVESGEPDGPLAVSSVLRLSTTLIGKPFRIRALVHGASENARARVCFGPAGGKMERVPLRFLNAGLVEAEIPPAGAEGSVMAYYIEVEDGAAKATWPANGQANPALVTVVPAPAQGLGQISMSVPYNRDSGKTRGATATVGPLLVQLSWPDIRSIRPPRVFRVMRATETGAEGEMPWREIARTRDCWYEDRSVEANSSYYYRVEDLDTGKTLAASAMVTVPEPPVPAPPTVKAASGPGRVRLSWEEGGFDVGGYAVYRSDSPDGPFVKIELPGLEPSGSGGRSCAVTSEPGKTTHLQMRSLSLTGKESAPSNTVSASALSADGPPVAKLEFDGTDPVPIGNRIVEEGLPAIRTGPDSFAALPHSDVYNTHEEISVEFWVKLMSPGVMPVLVSHGQWDVDGFFVQSLNGQVRFFLGGVGTLDTGAGIPLGKWTHVAATYDGTEMVVYLNGRRAGGRSASGSIRPAARTLYVGRYEIPGKEYEVDGYMSAFRLYPYALLPAEVERHYRETASKPKGQ